MSLLDLAAERWLGQRFDPEGGNASGPAHPRLLERWLDHPYFRLAPPKSTGREVFGPAWLDAREPDLAALPVPDRLATLAAFTAEAVARELGAWGPALPAGTPLLLSGGGARHQRVRQELAQRLPGLALEDDLKFPPGAREAVSWALLGAASAAAVPGSLPQVTGASPGGGAGQLGARGEGWRPAGWTTCRPGWPGARIASTGAYYPGELGTMALPLLGAALVQWRGWSLERWRRVLELAALAHVPGAAGAAGGASCSRWSTCCSCSAACAWPCPGAAPAPPDPAHGLPAVPHHHRHHRRAGLPAVVPAWVAGAAAVLLQLTWESAAALRQGPFPPPPRSLVAALDRGGAGPGGGLLRRPAAAAPGAQPPPRRAPGPGRAAGRAQRRAGPGRRRARPGQPGGGAAHPARPDPHRPGMRQDYAAALALLRGSSWKGWTASAGRRPPTPPGPARTRRARAPKAGHRGLLLQPRAAGHPAPALRPGGWSPPAGIPCASAGAAACAGPSRCGAPPPCGWP